MKKISDINRLTVILMAFAFMITLAGCTDKEPAYNMDQPAADGKYHYRNEDFGFSVVLPEIFMYYQTQRFDNPQWSDIEFFLPTSDTSYFQSVPGYGKVFLVRIFDRTFFATVSGDEDFSIYKKIAEKDNSIYTIKFWDVPPRDWKERWSEQVERDILDSFKLEKNAK